MKTKDIIIGQKQKNWTALSKRFKKSNLWYIKAVCSCGKQQDIVASRFLHITKYNKCNSCANKINNKDKKNNGYKSLGDLGGTFFNYIKKSAKHRNIDFNLTIEYLWDLYLKQNKKCALSGIEINLSREIINRRPNYKLITASLDRIDSSKGYVEDNVQWVHKWINIMKNSLSNNDFIYFCSKVFKFNHDNHEPSFEIRDLNFSRKVQRLTDEDTLSNNSDTSLQHPKMGDDIV